MHLTVKGHHLDITPSMRDYVDQRFGRAWRHFDHVNEVHVVLGVEKLNQTAEVTVHLPGKDIHCEASSMPPLTSWLTNSTVKSSGTRRPIGPACTVAKAPTSPSTPKVEEGPLNALQHSIYNPPTRPNRGGK
jgi:putative sigma-54 modulation protein